MKKILIALALGAVLALPVSAQTQKFGTIDLRKVFDNYWKTKQADANLKDEAAGLDKERKTMVDDFQKKQEEFKKLQEGATDPAISTEERDKRKKAAEEMLMKLRDLENNVKQFDAQARTTLGEKQRRMRDNLLGEIKDVIKAKAKGGGYSIVLDSAAETVNNTPVLLYNSGGYDITDEVLKDLNVNAPPAPKGSETKPEKEDKK